MTIKTLSHMYKVLDNKKVPAVTKLCLLLTFVYGPSQRLYNKSVKTDEDYSILMPLADKIVPEDGLEKHILWLAFDHKYKKLTHIHKHQQELKETYGGTLAYIRKRYLLYLRHINNITVI